jgi:hypothetical protein
MLLSPASTGEGMPTIREMNAGPPKRLIVRIAVAVAFVLAIYLYVSHVEARDSARLEAANRVLATINKGKPVPGARRSRRSTAIAWHLPRTVARHMGGLDGGRRQAWQPRPVATHTSVQVRGPLELTSQLSFSNDGRFVAAIDGPTITVWNAQDGSQL